MSSGKSLAQLEEELRRSNEREAALTLVNEALLARLSVSTPALGGGARIRGASLSGRAPPFPAYHQTLTSPTAGGSKQLLHDQEFWGLLDHPLSFAALGVAQSFSAVLAASLAAAKGRSPPSLAATCLMEEKGFYDLAISALPSDHFQKFKTQKSAQSLFGPGVLSRWALNRACKPELAVAVKRGGTRPVFQGEIKSVDPEMLGQTLYYMLLALAGEFFPPASGQGGGGGGEGGDPGGGVAQRIFYALPPLGFALLAFPHVGYFVSLEMVGKAIVAPCSHPFFLGSEQHKAAAASLPTNPRGPPVWELEEELLWHPRDSPRALGEGGQLEGTPAVMWSVSRDGKFRKILRGDARGSEEWAEMYAVYERLREVCGGGGEEGGDGGGGGGGGVAPQATPLPPPPPSLIRGARMLYGNNEALVEMPCVPCEATRPASNDEATGGPGGTPPPSPPILTAVAEAIAWLAFHARILYTDLRGPNVLLPALIPAPAPASSAAVAAAAAASPTAPAWLVDYDDCIVLGGPVGSVDAFRKALAEVEKVRAERRGVLSLAAPGFAARFVSGDFPHLEVALEAAFASLG